MLNEAAPKCRTLATVHSELLSGNDCMLAYSGQTDSFHASKSSSQRKMKILLD